MNAAKDKIIADIEDELAAREELLNKREAAIQALKDEITQSNEYLAEIESTVDEVLNSNNSPSDCVHCINQKLHETPKHANFTLNY